MRSIISVIFVAIVCFGAFVNTASAADKVNMKNLGNGNYLITVDGVMSPDNHVVEGVIKLRAVNAIPAEDFDEIATVIESVYENNYTEDVTDVNLMVTTLSEVFMKYNKFFIEKEDVDFLVSHNPIIAL